MNASSSVAVTNIVELSSQEILAVFGGTGSVPIQTRPGACPPGTQVSSATYNSQGQLTSLTCTPTSTTQSVQTGVSLATQAAELAKSAWDALGGLFD